jgi:hypothetical protein
MAILQGVKFQVSGVNKQMPEDRKLKSNMVLHFPVFTIFLCHLTSDT